MKFDIGIHIKVVRRISLWLTSILHVTQIKPYA